MLRKIYTIRQRVFVELKKYCNNRKGGISIVLLGLTILMIFILILVQSMDYLLFKYKRTLYTKSLDLAVCAAAQEINISGSNGIKNEFDKNGKASTDNIVLDETKALNAFYAIMKTSINVDREKLQPYVLSLIVNPTDKDINYTIYKGGIKTSGSVVEPAELETIVNSNMNFVLNSVDSQKIFVNGNIQTNSFKKKPYFLCFIKDLEINGLFSKNTATLISFQAARYMRK